MPWAQRLAEKTHVHSITRTYMCVCVCASVDLYVFVRIHAEVRMYMCMSTYGHTDEYGICLVRMQRLPISSPCQAKSLHHKLGEQPEKKNVHSW